MEYKIDTKIICESIEKNTLMPYFLNKENINLFNEQMSMLYEKILVLSNIKEKSDILLFNDQIITETQWNKTKFVGSFFTALYSHWSKIIKQTNIFFVEVNENFPDQLILDLDKNSFVVFYRGFEGMISKRDECILETSNIWMLDFFNWLFCEINQVGNISNLFKKYQSFTELFVTDKFKLPKEEDETEEDEIEENELFELPKEFYENLEEMQNSIIYVLEEELNGQEPKELDTIQKKQILNRIRENIKQNKIESSNIKNESTIKIIWNKKEVELNLPIDFSNWINNKEIELIDNNNAWLALQETEVQQTTFAIWLEYILTKNGNIKSDEILNTNWEDFYKYVKDWLREDSGIEIKQIEKKIENTYSKLIKTENIKYLQYCNEPAKFLKSMLFIEKQTAVFLNKKCIIDVENIQNQYYYNLNNKSTLIQIWEVIIHEKIQKNKGKKTFANQFENLKEKFPNFKDVIDYYSGAMYLFEQTGTPPAPILLLGEPGLGKTHFSNEIAKVIGSQMTVISISSLSAGWIISGSSTQWKDSQMGKIATSLFNSSSNSPVIVLDEIDKKSEGNYDPIGALYPLLEYQTAKEFVDEHLEFPLDASNVIWVATANSLNNIPEPILDRFVVFGIKKLNHNETFNITKTIFSELTNGLIPENLSEDILELLKDKTPRQIKQILKKALAYAAIQRTQNIVLKKEHIDLSHKIKKIGF